MSSADHHDDLDHLGERRLSVAASWWWYAVAFVSYVGLGIFHKWLLNWFVGPAWLILVVWVGPLAVDGLRAVFGGRRASST